MLGSSLMLKVMLCCKHPVEVVTAEPWQGFLKCGEGKGSKRQTFFSLVLIEKIDRVKVAQCETFNQYLGPSASQSQSIKRSQQRGPERSVSLVVRSEAALLIM